MARNIDFTNVKKGDTVWYYSSYEKKLLETTVKSIGPKYITITNSHETKFNRVTGVEAKYNGSPDVLYLTDTEYYDGVKRSNNVRRIERIIQRYSRSITLEQSEELLKMLSPLVKSEEDLRL